MDRRLRLRAERILTGTAEVEDGYIRSAIAGDNGKESATHVVEVLDEALTSPHCPPTLRRRFLATLPAICATYGTLPSRCSHAGHLIVEPDSVIRVGGAEVWRGTLDGFVVSVKSISYDPTGSPGGSQERAYREVITWKSLNHPNILSLLGVDTSSSPISAISVRTEYGSLREYIVLFPNAPRSKLLFDASQGLEYMHGYGCIHGDLKSSSILVNGDHSAVLANFRLAFFLSDLEGNTSVPTLECCDPWSVRWLAPELLFPEKFGLESARLTRETDIYAFAMVMYEAFSGLFPFEGHRDEAIIPLVRSGDHPRWPEGGVALGLTDELRKMIKACWKRRDRRWGISSITSALERHAVVAAAAATEGHSQSFRGSDEIPIPPAHETSPHRYPWRIRWGLGASLSRG